jgi:glycyl-tRNA synthetase beta subunit
MADSVHVAVQACLVCQRCQAHHSNVKLTVKIRQADTVTGCIITFPELQAPSGRAMS